MAWTTPRTWSTGETLSAANMNTHVRDDMLWVGSDAPHARATRSTNQSVSGGSDVAVTFPTEDYDVGTMHDTGSNTSRLTVPTGGGGVYRIGGYLRTDATGSGFTRALVNIRKNGSTELAASIWTPPSLTGVVAAISTEAALVATDYVEITLNHNNSAALNVTTAAIWASWAYV